MAVTHSDSWLEKVKLAEKTCVLANGIRKIHYKFPDSEMAEEYDMTTKLIRERKWRSRTSTGSILKWEYEIGEPSKKRLGEDSIIQEDPSNPFLYRVDTKDEFQWKIRNMPYPLSTYNVTVAGTAENAVIVKTTNKKYYKKISIPDLDRCGLQIEPSRLSVSHATNTLKITYKKPPEVITLEREVYEMLKKLKAVNEACDDDNCKQS